MAFKRKTAREGKLQYSAASMKRGWRTEGKKSHVLRLVLWTSGDMDDQKALKKCEEEQSIV